MSSKNSREKFLEALYGDYFSQYQGYIEIRLIISNALSAKAQAGRKIVGRYFFSSIERLSSATFQGVNTYFGVCPRRTRRGTEDAIRHITTFWADVDSYKEFGTIGESVRYAYQFPYPPSVMVHSGGGLHLYWLLKEPEEASHLHREIINGLGQAFHGDPVHDLARMMRLPNTLNTKYPRPKRVAILKLDTNIRYTSTDFEEIAIPVQLPAIITIQDKDFPKVNISRLAIPQRIKDLILLGDREGAYPSRSERDQAIINHLVRINCSPALIRSIFANPSLPISDKYLEKRRYGDKYLTLTIGKAKSSQQGCYAY